MTTLERIALLRSQGAATITVHPDGSVTGGFMPLPPLRIVAALRGCRQQVHSCAGDKAGPFTAVNGFNSPKRVAGCLQTLHFGAYE